MGYFSPHPFGRRPCWHCHYYAGMLYAGSAAACTLPLAARVRSAPATGCSAFEREPGADDVPDEPPPADGPEAPTSSAGQAVQR